MSGCVGQNWGQNHNHNLPLYIQTLCKQAAPTCCTASSRQLLLVWTACWELNAAKRNKGKPTLQLWHQHMHAPSLCLNMHNISTGIP